MTAIDLLRVLQRHGFDVVRQSGSHCIVAHADGRRTTVPLHRGRDLAKGTLRAILRDTQLTVDDLIDG
jgi:predicted RNA binding protein YcfA (HicA-like mRNA interferase family)